MSQPDVLWHYTTFDSLTKILGSKSLLATDYRALNDGSEFKTGISLLRRFYGSSGLDAATKEKSIVDFEDGVLLDLETRIEGQIISLSAARDSLSMWRGYGGLLSSANPVALGFATKDLWTLAAKSGFSGPAEVDYEVGQIPNLSRGDKEAAKSFAESHLKGVDTLKQFVKLRKNRHFQEEAEFRLLTDGHFGTFEKRINAFSEVFGEFRKKLFLSLDENEIWQGLERPLGIKKVLIGPRADKVKIERYLANFFRMYSCDHPDIEVSNIPFV